MATFTLKGARELQRTFAALGADAPRAAGAALYGEGERIMGRSKKLVPVDMGELRASGHVQLPVITQHGASVRLGYGGAGSEYGIYVHEGTGPAVGNPTFMPPSSAIEGWVMRNIGPPSSDLARVTFLVARAIGEHGARPNPFLRAPLDEARAGFDGRIAAGMRTWLERQRVA